MPEVQEILQYDLDEPNKKLKKELDEIEKQKDLAIKLQKHAQSELEHYMKGNLPKNI